jgi:hypothetical protein
VLAGHGKVKAGEDGIAGGGKEWVPKADVLRGRRMTVALRVVKFAREKTDDTPG